MEPNVSTPQTQSVSILSQSEPKKNNSKLLLVVLGILVLIGLSGGGGYYIGLSQLPKAVKPEDAVKISPNPTLKVACTTDAKLCPDGSYVSRSGPNCEFAECPEENSTTLPDWNTYINTKKGYSIQYPKILPPYIGEWTYEEFGDQTGFGTESSKSGGYFWGVMVYESGNLENIIKKSGSQFSDRQETRKEVSIGGLPALVVTVTSPSNPKWVSRDVYLEKFGKIYVIMNGAQENAAFDTFYNSFRFLNH